MKSSITIFAMYLQILAILPCDGYGIGVLKIFESCFGIEHHHDMHEELDTPFNGCEDDGCTPFCTCNCCSIPAQQPTDLKPVLKELVSLPAIAPNYIPDLKPRIFRSFVWHPPAVQ